MKKSILLLGGVGIGVGLAFALRSHHDDRSNTSDVEGNGDKTDGRASQNTIGAEIQVSGPENVSIEKSVQPAAASMKNAGDETADDLNESELEIDDRGTGQQTASQMLKSIRDAAFEASNEKLALALGRPTEEIEAWTSGSGIIDSDAVIKARALANERGVEFNMPTN